MTIEPMGRQLLQCIGYAVVISIGYLFFVTDRMDGWTHVCTHRFLYSLLE